VASRSPGDDKLTPGYADGWAAINRLVREGSSWSGREMNCAFLNLGDGRFSDVSHTSGLAFPDDGRAFARVDWDLDGDLDLWIVNRSAPQIRFMRNNAAEPARSLALRLTGRNVNRDAIGSHVAVRAGQESWVRVLQAGTGYISQSSKWLHFGVGDAERVDEVTVRWPDGTVQRFTDVATGRRYRLRQGDDALEPEAEHGSRNKVHLTPTVQDVIEPTEVANLGLTWRVAVPPVRVTDFEGREHVVGAGGRPLLVNFWASWCPSCLHELDQWTRAQNKIEGVGLDILALAVDEIQADVGQDPAREVVERLGCWFATGAATDELLLLFEVLQSSLIDRMRRLPVPAGFLLDGEGRLARIYKGPVELERLLQDVDALSLSGLESARRALPFSGRWHKGPHLPGLLRIANRLLEQEAPALAAHFVMEALPFGEDSSRAVRSRMVRQLVKAGQQLIDQGRPADASVSLERAVEIDPDDGRIRELLGLARTGAGDAAGALAAYQQAARIDPSRAGPWVAMGVQHMMGGDAARALEAFRRSVELDPGESLAWTGIGTIQCARGNLTEGAQSLERALEINPSNQRAQAQLDSCR
jgi:tetratricopeptide (TPR) repeat protein